MLGKTEGRRTRGRKRMMVKQEMARVIINILGINELKWIGMSEFNSDDHISTTVSKNPIELE